MKKPIQTNSPSLAIAKKEFEDFKDKQKSRSVVNPLEYFRPKEDHNQSEQFLYCSKKVGERSRLKTTLTSTQMEIMGAVIVGRDPNSASKAQPGQQQIFTRKLKIGQTYKGCPHCRNGGFVYCNGCKTLSCWDGKTSEHRCPVCSNESQIGQTGIEISFTRQDDFKRLASAPPIPTQVGMRKPVLLSVRPSLED
ncbi:MAG: TerY-C metal binding domain-containing protein [Telluria sp.]